MRAIIQRVKQASVEVDKKIVGSINHGLLIFLGVTHDDTETDVDYLVKKILNMRIFEDAEGKMNHSLLDFDYELLSVSQFTLHANTKKGNRPSFTDSAKPKQAESLYIYFNERVKKAGIHLETGVFAAMMDVSLINDGPVTISLDSKNK